MARRGGREVVDSPMQSAKVVTTTLTFAFAVAPSKANLLKRFTTKQGGAHANMGRYLAAPTFTQIVGRKRAVHRSGYKPIHQRRNTRRLQHDVIVEKHHPRRAAKPPALIPRSGNGVPTASVVLPRFANDAMDRDMYADLLLNSALDVGMNWRGVAGQ